MVFNENSLYLYIAKNRSQNSYNDILNFLFDINIKYEDQVKYCSFYLNFSRKITIILETRLLAVLNKFKTTIIYSTFQTYFFSNLENTEFISVSWRLSKRKQIQPKYYSELWTKILFGFTLTILECVKFFHFLGFSSF